MVHRSGGVEQEATPIFQGAADFDLDLIERRTLDGHIQERDLPALAATLSSSTRPSNSRTLPWAFPLADMPTGLMAALVTRLADHLPDSPGRSTSWLFSNLAAALAEPDGGAGGQVDPALGQAHAAVPGGRRPRRTPGGASTGPMPAPPARPPAAGRVTPEVRASRAIVTTTCALISLDNPGDQPGDQRAPCFAIA